MVNGPRVSRHHRQSHNAPPLSPPHTIFSSTSPSLLVILSPSKMGINGPFAAMLKACSPHLKIKTALGEESPLNDTISVICTPVTGIDMSVIMMSAVKSDRGAEEFHQDPPYPTQHVAVAVLKLLRMIK